MEHSLQYLLKRGYEVLFIEAGVTTVGKYYYRDTDIPIDTLMLTIFSGNVIIKCINHIDSTSCCWIGVSEDYTSSKELQVSSTYRTHPHQRWQVDHYPLE